MARATRASKPGGRTVESEAGEDPGGQGGPGGERDEEGQEEGGPGDPEERPGSVGPCGVGIHGRMVLRYSALVNRASSGLRYAHEKGHHLRDVRPDPPRAHQHPAPGQGDGGVPHRGPVDRRVHRRQGQARSITPTRSASSSSRPSSTSTRSSRRRAGSRSSTTFSSTTSRSSSSATIGRASSISSSPTARSSTCPAPRASRRPGSRPTWPTAASQNKKGSNLYVFNFRSCEIQASGKIKK